ncbi:MAG: arginase family protein [Acidimicrobiales bacterium]|jgi:agmatinase
MSHDIEPQSSGATAAAVDPLPAPPPTRAPGPMDLNRYETEMAWQGIQTFMKLPLCLTPEDLRAGAVDVAIAGVPWDQTAMTRSGTHLGPKAIRGCDHLPSPPWSRPHLHVRVDPFEHLDVCDYSDAEVIIGNTERTSANVRAFVGEILEAGALPIILGATTGSPDRRRGPWPTTTATARSVSSTSTPMPTRPRTCRANWPATGHRCAA